MKKKFVWIVVVCIVLLISGSVYFHPMVLADEIEENNTFSIQVIATDVQNGEVHTDTKSQDNVTGQQKEEIIALLKTYSYKRTLKTYISDNAMEQTGSRSIFLFIYDGDTLLHTICVTDSGQITVDDRLYKMKNARQLNDEIENIVRRTY